MKIKIGTLNVSIKRKKNGGVRNPPFILTSSCESNITISERVIFSLLTISLEGFTGDWPVDYYPILLRPVVETPLPVDFINKKKYRYIRCYNACRTGGSSSCESNKYIISLSLVRIVFIFVICVTIPYI